MKKETIQTIAMILLCLLLMFADSIMNKLFAQVFIGPGISNKGMVMQMGVLSNKTEISASYVVPFTKATNARIISLQVGQKFNLTKWDSDNYSLMPYFGYGFLRWKDFAAYENDPSGKTGIYNMREFKPIVGIQIGKFSHAGEVIAFTQYCNTFYYGIGLKCYFSKL